MVTGDQAVHHLRSADPALVVGLAGLLRVRRRTGGRRVMTDDEIETQLPKLIGMTLADLQGLEALDADRQVLLGQVEKPRFNIGSGPPGRAD